MFFLRKVLDVWKKKTKILQLMNNLLLQLVLKHALILYNRFKIKGDFLVVDGTQDTSNINNEVKNRFDS